MAGTLITTYMLIGAFMFGLIWAILAASKRGNK